MSFTLGPRAGSSPTQIPGRWDLEAVSGPIPMDRELKDPTASFLSKCQMPRLLTSHSAPSGRSSIHVNCPSGLYPWRQFDHVGSCSCPEYDHVKLVSDVVWRAEKLRRSVPRQTKMRLRVLQRLDHHEMITLLALSRSSAQLSNIDPTVFSNYMDGQRH